MSATFQTVGINQEPAAGTNYPFVAPSSDVQYLLGDLFISFDDDACAVQLPLRITQLTNFNNIGVARRDVQIEDANNTAVFDSTTIDAAHYTDNAWGLNLRTICWTGDNAVLRLTMRGAGPPWDADKTWASSITPVNGQLDARCSLRLPRRVRSIYVGGQGPTTRMTGNVQLVEGYNIGMTVTSPKRKEGGRFIQQVGISAEPGQGLGRVPGCNAADPDILTINNIPATESGDFTLDTDGCYRLQRPTALIHTAPRQAVLVAPDLSSGNEANYGLNLAQLQPYGEYTSRAALEEAMEITAALQIINDCSPCCTCSDYVDVYEGIRRLYFRYQKIGQDAEAMRNLLQENIVRWEAQKACRQQNGIRILAQPEAAYKLYVAGIFCNNTGGCIAPLTLRMTFQNFQNGAPVDISSGVTLQCGEQIKSATDTGYADAGFVPLGAYPVMGTNYALIDKQSAARVRMRLQLSGGSINTVKVTLTAHIADNAVYDPATRHVMAPPPALTVPADVAAVWAAASAPTLPPVRAIATQTVPLYSAGGPNGCA